MNKSEYMQNLLGLCTDKQKNLFYRMYPTGPNNSQLKTAINQIENTLKNLNATKSDLRDANRATDEAKEERSKEFSGMQQILRYTEEALQEAKEEIKKLSNPISTENKEIQERLNLLDALEAGGVDNWEFYDVCIEEHLRAS